MGFYRKKPVVIEARQLTIKNAVELATWCSGLLIDDPEDGGYNIIIPTLEGDHKALLDDFIIKGVAEEFYPCKPEIFEKTYEEVQ